MKQAYAAWAFTAALLGAAVAATSPTDKEVAWSAYLATQVNGEAEHRLPSGARVDVLTDDTAWEVEWTEKWPESVGQSLYYGAATGRDPGIWLLKRGNANDEDWNECLAVVTYLRGKGVPMQFRTTNVETGQ